MWQVDVPLVEFYDAIVEAGRQAGYLALLTALVRGADLGAFYKDITRYWDSLHDVTGSDVLFVLAGPNASNEVNYHGAPDGREPIAYSSSGAAVVSADGRPIRPRLSHWGNMVTGAPFTAVVGIGGIVLLSLDYLDYSHSSVQQEMGWWE